jgi:hypothetical protein
MGRPRHDGATGTGEGNDTASYGFGAV